MTGRLFVDTNILIYALDPQEPQKRTVSADLLRRTISNHTLTLSPQSLNETYRVLTQRHRIMPVAEARSFVRLLAPWAIAPLDASITQRAWTVQDEAGLSWWDSLLIASALEAGCRLFVSEDMSDGAMIESLRIVNPFTAEFARSLAKI